MRRDSMRCIPCARVRLKAAASLRACLPSYRVAHSLLLVSLAGANSVSREMRKNGREAESGEMANQCGACEREQ